MRPSFAMNDGTDSHHVDAKFPRKGILADTAGCIAPTDIADVLFSHLSVPMPFAAGKRFRVKARSVFVPKRCAIAPFSGPVERIVFVGSKPEMARVLAGRIIARVQDTKTVGDRTVGDGPSNTMGAKALPLKPKLAIAIPKATCLPFPTFVGLALLDFCPEAFFVLRRQRRDDTMFSRHDSLLFRGLCLERRAA